MGWGLLLSFFSLFVVPREDGRSSSAESSSLANSTSPQDAFPLTGKASWPWDEVG